MINYEFEEYFNLEKFLDDLKSTNLIYRQDFILRFVSALCANRFLILTGLTGSGKTKLAQAFASWLTGDFMRSYFNKNEEIKANRSTYRIIDSDRLGVLIDQSGSETKTFLPYELILIWKNVIKSKNYTEETPSQVIQKSVEESGILYSKTLNSFHAPLKALAFGLKRKEDSINLPVKAHYRLIPIGSDWTNREPLLGYPNALEPGKYVKPDNGVLDLLIDAMNNPNLPFFLILDEMNLSHVERYFADFLSAMESKEPIPLHSNKDGMVAHDGTEIPTEIYLPDNLFIIGTVNIDETTYMFSPKVLDRAGVIEFRVDDEEMRRFLSNPVKANIDILKGKGISMSGDFLQKVRQKNTDIEDRNYISEELIKFFSELKCAGAEFGYRTASEIVSYVSKVRIFEGSKGEQMSRDNILDSAVAQKLLPKLHGSRKKIVPVLEKLASLCLNNPGDLELTATNNKRAKKDKTLDIKYSLSFEKICRMYDRAIQEGFASFAEA